MPEHGEIQDHVVVALGSTNAAKMEGTKRAFAAYFREFDLRTVDPKGVVRAQPLTLNETLEGAHARAEYAAEQRKADFGVGVEAGIVDLGKGHHLNLQIAAIVDTSDHLSFGCSSGFPVPEKLVSTIKESHTELDRYTIDLIGVKKVPEEEGIVYTLTKKKLSRVDMTEQCVKMALVPWLNREAYFR